MKTAILFLLTLISCNPAWSCNNSSFTLVSVIENPVGTFTINANFCTGHGRTGIVFGADGPTSTFSVCVWSSQGDAATQAALQSFSATVTGPPYPAPGPGTTYQSFQAGPGFTLGEQDNIIFFDPFGQDYACISSSANCGPAGTWCQPMTFVYQGFLPDSMRLLGHEGLAPAGGCYPNNDEILIFTNLPIAIAEATNKTPEPVRCFDINGITVPCDQPGRHFVEYANGETKLVYLME